MSKDKTDLKLASSKHIPALLDFIQSYYDFESITYLENKVEKALRSLLNSEDIGRVWLITFNDEPVGYIILCFSYSLVSYGQDGMIDEFYIKEKYRNKGIGTEVIKQVIKNSKKLGLKSLYLEVNKHNKEAQSFYNSLKFKKRDNYFLMNLDL
ncbi:MAG TPA: GNAT family N-acetyltransferase [Thermodesulfobacteriota bacterium]|nr:GNAT family N-acetyltransferase [Thermodesulfobacteriota bacterium]